MKGTVRHTKREGDCCADDILAKKGAAQYFNFVQLDHPTGDHVMPILVNLLAQFSSEKLVSSSFYYIVYVLVI